jgi:hypothetical protein
MNDPHGTIVCICVALLGLHVGIAQSAVPRFVLLDPRSGPDNTPTGTLFVGVDDPIEPRLACPAAGEYLSLTDPALT